MTIKTYCMTETAENHFWKALHESKQKWGHKRAAKYRVDFLKGLQHIAESHQTFNSPHREELSEGTEFSIHLVEHRYVAFQEYDKNTIIIVGIFHENMDISTRLKELQSMAQQEIEVLKRDIERTQNKKSLKK
ncbi:MAG: type II toxin-antitoxin system RelE/ParE family toxin [Pseudomonadota bacterium]